MKIEFFSADFWKIFNNKFNENPSSWSQVVPCGWMAGWMNKHDEANSHFSQFSERA